MKGSDEECLTKNKRRSSSLDQSPQQASTLTSNKKRKLSKKTEGAPGCKSVQLEKNSKNKPNSKNQHVCDKCLKVFEDAFDLVKHKCTPFKCLICSKDFDSDVHLKNHELTHEANAEGTSAECKFCSTKLDSQSSLTEHETLCKKKNLKQCSMCNKKMHPRSKHDLCKKCIISDKNVKDYGLRRNSKDVIQTTVADLLENVGNCRDAALITIQLDTATIGDSYQQESVNKINVRNVTTKGKINKPAKLHKKSKNNLSSKLNGSEIQETSIVQNKLPDPDDVFRRDTHINIRKTFDKSKKVFPSENIEVIKKVTESVHDETLSVFKKPKSIALVRNKLNNLSKYDLVSSKADKNAKKQGRKNQDNGLVKNTVSKSKLISKKQENIVNEKMNGNSFSNNQTKMKEDATSKVGYLSNVEVKIESLIDSLPDSSSGILLKCFGNKIDYKCVKCCKQFGNVDLACNHYSSCKIKIIRLKKQLTSLNNVLWFCTMCNSNFDLVADLLKHKTSCSTSVLQNTFQKKINPIAANQNYDEKFLYKCNKCGYTCFSPIIFETHPCEESVKFMRNCYVKVDNSRNLELKAKNVTYYNCKVCKKDFLNPKVYDSHMRNQHHNVYDGSLHPLSLQIRKVAQSVKQEANYDYPFEHSTPIISQAASLSSIYPLSSLESSLQKPKSSKNQVSSNLYRIPRVAEPRPIDGNYVNKIIQCNHARTDSRIVDGDIKPCMDCLKSFSENRIFDMFRNALLDRNFESNDILQAQYSRSTTSGYHPRSFPTPPATPDNVSCQSQSSQNSESQASISGTSTNMRLNSSACNSAEKETSNLNLILNSKAGDVDAIALVVSESDLSVSKYLCASCYAELNENEVCDHMRCRHNKTSGDVHVACIENL